MSRRARYSVPSGIYHVMFRGNNKQNIFSSDEERRRFCLIMEEGVERFQHQILAFCFMTNHVHLVIKTGEISLSKICQNVAFRYAKFYNYRHEACGHLFQGRFKSILVVGEKYVRSLIRYVHLNPVRAKIVDDPSDYRWSSHNVYLRKESYQWLSYMDGLCFFGRDLNEATKEYQSFISSEIKESEQIDFKNGIEEGVVADDAFIESMNNKLLNKVVKTSEIRLDLETFVEVVASYYEVDINELRNSGKDRVFAQIRAKCAYLVRYVDGIALKSLADFFNRAQNSLSEAGNLFELQMIKSERLKSEIEMLKAKLIKLGSDVGNRIYPG
jgi:putative transposase